MVFSVLCYRFTPKDPHLYKHYANQYRQQQTQSEEDATSLGKCALF